ncbi:TetR/AcrR family transcriptional regulator [Ruegeria sp. HKCCD8929]|uniref:TetR/AcrR family transcriptional regulator n=1 Tax=Ruegeria sp. HKCCD8929 TaxID=2683006 RepID=UPI0014885DC6|nr:TetR/AcrR family transcriptional regulator [Ruegeria sp. HKCCD8929]
MDELPKLRGRPKTLDRVHVLETAVMQYWEHGPTEVSINDICKLAQASKPGIYREFGSDDGLKAAALRTYQALAVDPFLALLTAEQPLARTLEEIVAFLMQDRDKLGIPKGCLFVSMRSQRDMFSPETLGTMDQLREHFLARLALWIDATKVAGEFRPEVPTKIAAHQIDTLHSGAMRMQRENVPASEIEGFLRFGLAAVSGETRVLTLRSRSGTTDI